MNKYFNLLLILLFSSFNAFLLSMTPDERDMFNALAASEKDEKDRRDRQRKNENDLNLAMAMSLSLQNNDMPKKLDPKMQRELDNQLAMTILTFFSDMDLESNFNHPSIPKEQFFKNINKIKELISKGANINTEVDCKFRIAIGSIIVNYKYIKHTILSLIAANINIVNSMEVEKFIKFLIENGADINFTTKSDEYSEDNRTCLSYIVENFKKLDFIYFIIKSNNVNLKIKDKAGRTLLMKIISKSDSKNVLKIIEYLIKSGQIDINAQDIDGNTVLSYLLANKLLDHNTLTELFKLLINVGANPTITNNKNMRVLDILGDMHKKIYNDYKNNLQLSMNNNTPFSKDVINLILGYL